MPEFCVTFASKIILLHEQLTKFSNFTWHLPEKMSKFCMIIAQKIFISISFFFGKGGARAPCPLLLRLWILQVRFSRNLPSPLLQICIVFQCKILKGHVQRSRSKPHKIPKLLLAVNVNENRKERWANLYKDWLTVPAGDVWPDSQNEAKTSWLAV